jgi:hypothetical protein
MAPNFERCTLCGKLFDTYAEKELYFDNNNGFAHAQCVRQAIDLEYPIPPLHQVCFSLIKILSAPIAAGVWALVSLSNPPRPRSKPARVPETIQSATKERKVNHEI